MKGPLVFLWLVLTAAFITLHLFAETHPWNEERLKTTTDTLACSAFLLALPVSTPSMFLLASAGRWLPFPLIGSDSPLNEHQQLAILAAGDFGVCVLYLVVVLAVYKMIHLREGAISHPE